MPTCPAVSCLPLPSTVYLFPITIQPFPIPIATVYSSLLSSTTIQHTVTLSIPIAIVSVHFSIVPILNDLFVDVQLIKPSSIKC